MGEFAKSEIIKVIDYLTHLKIQNKISNLKFEIKEYKNELIIQPNEKNEEKSNLINAAIKDFKSEIKDLNKTLLKYNSAEPKIDEDYCKKLIKLVGEPMLRNSLIDLYGEVYPT
jgi:hypothetical protein